MKPKYTPEEIAAKMYDLATNGREEKWESHQYRAVMHQHGSNLICLYWEDAQYSRLWTITMNDKGEILSVT